MKIDRENYEAYFIDYLEGNLDEKLVDDFLEFLQQNPDLKEELSLYQSVSLELEEIQFDKKDLLLKQKYDLEDQFNQNSVAWLEGDLNEDEKIAFENYLNAHPDKKKEFQLFQKTKLHPDSSVKFSKKRSLYHHSAGKTILLWSYRVAAVLVLALTLYVFADRYSTQNIEEKKLAVVEKENPENESTQQEVPVKTVQPEEVQKQEAKPVEKVEQEEELKEIKPIEPEISKPVQNKSKSLRENNNGRLHENDVAVNRIQVEPLETIARLTASLDVESPQANLKAIRYTMPEDPGYQEEERFLADVVKEKTGLDKLTFTKIAKTGLNIVSSISNDKLSYETNKSGKVTEINYDSRLFAFSLPTKNE